MGSREAVVSLELGAHTDSLMEGKNSMSSAGPQTANVGDCHGKVLWDLSQSDFGNTTTVAEFVHHLVTTGWVLEMWN